MALHMKLTQINVDKIPHGQSLDTLRNLDLGTILAPVLIVVAASVSSSTAFSEELWYLNPSLSDAQNLLEATI